MQIYEPGEDDPITPPDDAPPPEDDEAPIPPEPAEDETIVDGEPPDIAIPAGGERRAKIYVDGVGATIIAERVEYLDENGKLVTETLRDFTRKALKKRFASLDDFLKRWKAAERKQAIIDELANEGLILDPLAEEVGKDLDPFDLICHVAFDQPPLTRRERAENVTQARRFHEVRRPGPGRARRAPGEVPGRGRARPRGPAGPTDHALRPRWARPSSSSDFGTRPISSAPCTNSKPLSTRKPLSHGNYRKSQLLWSFCDVMKSPTASNMPSRPRWSPDTCIDSYLSGLKDGVCCSSGYPTMC